MGHWGRRRGREFLGATGRGPEGQGYPRKPSRVPSHLLLPGGQPSHPFPQGPTAAPCPVLSAPAVAGPQSSPQQSPPSARGRVGTAPAVAGPQSSPQQSPPSARGRVGTAAFP